MRLHKRNHSWSPTSGASNRADRQPVARSDSCSPVTGSPFHLGGGREGAELGQETQLQKRLGSEYTFRSIQATALNPWEKNLGQAFHRNDVDLKVQMMRVVH